MVVTAHDGARLARCLSSLHGPAVGEVPFEVVVVLNGADDDVVEAARAVGGVRLVESPWNLGFAGASNLGRAHARGELIVLLHDDAEAEAGWLRELVEAAERHPEAGVVGSLGAVAFSDASTARVEGAHGPVDYCSSSSAVVRAAAWDAIGGLDELLFPGGYVDADLGMAARAAGWVVRCEPSAVVRHPSGGSMSGGFRAFVHARNRERFRTKWAVQLEEHEPPSSDATERALSRAKARADDIAARETPAVSARPAEPDPELGQRLATLELRLRREYIATADAELERVHREYARDHGELQRVHREYAAVRAALDAARAELDALRAKHASARGELDAIRGGGWWRLRGRLLPLLRLGRRLRAGRRPASS